MAKITRFSIRQQPSIRQRVYVAIRNDILNGRILPGERMIETRLASQIKTSRTPVREALHMLEMEGLLESIPRVGYSVKTIGWDEIEEICEIRAVNETLAARWAMKRITPRDSMALEKNIYLSETAVREGRPRSFVQYDAEFHEIIASASGSKRLLELCQLLRRHMLRYRIESIFHKETVLRAIKGHKGIMACIKNRDERAIEQAIREHLEMSKQSIRRYAFAEDPSKRGDCEGKK